MAHLTDILYTVALEQVIGNTNLEISGLAFDSRKVTSNSLFVAIKGTVSDGHLFIEKAVSLGAKAIICEEIPSNLTDGITYLKVKNSAKALGTIATNYYQHPSKNLKLVGVTGTNGKTTVATLLYKLFRELGFKVGLISTVENQINDIIIPSTHTTPDPIALNELLLDMVNSGCDYCFMEVSSHAVAQYRIEGLAFTGAIFTNITHDHLDFHLTFENYIKAKKAFFDGLPKSAFALTNTDDKNGMVMLQNTKASKKTYALKQMADFKAKVALEAIRGDLTLAELAAKHGVHHTMIASWKRQAIDGMAGTFSGAGDVARAASESEVEKLHAKIGQLVVERDFLESSIWEEPLRLQPDTGFSLRLAR